ncbi:hypothetical protein TURU_167198 [Turdus rufiventris]|nr:hypothetical protein TURU_167198 [Turdus rufiventris]
MCNASLTLSTFHNGSKISELLDIDKKKRLKTQIKFFYMPYAWEDDLSAALNPLQEDMMPRSLRNLLPLLRNS